MFESTVGLTFGTTGDRLIGRATVELRDSRT